MPKPTLTVTLPGGSIAKRQTERTYLYVLAQGPRSAEIEAASLNEQATREETLALALETAADAGHVSVRSRGFRTGGEPDIGFMGKPNYSNFEAWLSGLSGDINVYTHCNSRNETEAWGTYTEDGVHTPGARQIVDVTEALVGQARGRARQARDSAVAKRARAAGLLNGDAIPESQWEVLRWTSRLNLAEDAKSKFSYRGELGHELRIIPVG